MDMHFVPAPPCAYTPERAPVLELEVSTDGKSWLPAPADPPTPASEPSDLSSASGSGDAPPSARPLAP